MERRHIYFFVLSGLLITAHLALRTYFAPPPAAEIAAEQEKPGEVGTEQPVVVETTQADEGTAKVPTAEPEKPAEIAAPTDPVPAPVTPTISAAPPRQRLTIGSVDPSAANPYGMLVTLDSKGAAVERVELSNPHYRDIIDLYGYLGHLHLKTGETGCVVTVVGAGTPAASASEETSAVTGGLLAGDILKAIDATPIETPVDLDEYLAKQTKPGQIVTLDVQRTTEGKAQNLQFTTKLTRRPLDMIQPETHDFRRADGSRGRYSSPDPFSFLMKLDSISSSSVRSGEDELRSLPSLQTLIWQIEKQSSEMVEFSAVLTPEALAKIGAVGELKVLKRYRLETGEKGGGRQNHLLVEIELINLGREVLPVSYRLDGPNGLPLEGWWYSNKLHPDMWAAAGARDVAWKLSEKPHHLVGCPKIYEEGKASVTDKQKKLPTETSLLEKGSPSAIDYVGVDCQFFSAVIVPQPTASGPLVFRRIVARPVQPFENLEKRRVKTMNVSVQLGSPVESVPAGGSVEHKYLVFLGPKEPGILEQYKLGAMLEYGWSYAAIPAKILRGLLKLFYWIIPNYGIAIILLTVTVRSLMLPVSLKQARSAAMMQQLQPEIAKIREKHKDDNEKINKATWELYKKHNFNPFGGCLPLFFQLPVFIGLYRCLSVDIDLRDADLWPGMQWCTNLAGPDALFYWKDMVWPIIGDEADGWFGPFFNVFPLITCSLFILQQKLFTPPATDEQTAMQQKMMMYMTVFMGVMFYKVPAGLCLYFITSSLWGIAERKLLKSPSLAGSPAAKPAGKPATAK